MCKNKKISSTRLEIKSVERMKESISDLKEILKCDKYKLDKDDIKHIKTLIENEKEELKTIENFYLNLKK